MSVEPGSRPGGSTSNLDSTINSFFGPQEGSAIAAEMRAAREAASAGKKKTTKPSTVKYPTISSKTAAQNLVTTQFIKYVKREPTAAELKKFTDALLKAQADNPKVQTYKRVGDVATQITTGGLDSKQWLENAIQADDKLLPELFEVGTVDPEIIRRRQEKATYDKLIKSAKGNQAKIAKINATNPYGIAVRNLQDVYSSEINKAGAAVDEGTLFSVAQQAYDTYQDRNASSLNNFFNTKMQFAPTGVTYKGEAGEQYTDLLRTASANGLDLNRTFGTQIPTWLQSINKGESVETFKKLIRDTAKIGMPEKVTKLLDQGIDLKSIYAPYQNIMENILELAPGSVDLNDPILRSAITSQNEIPLYDFQRQLRKDPRWQYTNNAREEMATITQSILKDFGFQG